MNDSEKTAAEGKAEEAHAVEEAIRKAKEDADAMKEAASKWNDAEEVFNKRSIPFSSSEYKQKIKERQNIMRKEWNEQKKAKQTTTPEPKFKNNNTLSPYQKNRVSCLDLKYQGVITACIECNWPFPMVFPVEQLARMDDTIADMHAEYPQMKTLHELGIFLGVLFSDGYFDSHHFGLSTTNPAHARVVRDAISSAEWRKYEGKVVAEDEFEAEGVEIEFVEEIAVEEEVGVVEEEVEEVEEEEEDKEEEKEDKEEEEEEEDDPIYDPNDPIYHPDDPKNPGFDSDSDSDSDIDKEEEEVDEEEADEEEEDDDDDEEEDARELKVTADGMRISDMKSSNNASSRHFQILSEVAAPKTKAHFYDVTTTSESTGSKGKKKRKCETVKKRVPKDWLDPEKSFLIITLALTATPAFSVALWVGDGSVKRGGAMSVALCDFPKKALRWFIHIHEQLTRRHGTTGEEIHGGWPMEMQKMREHFRLAVTAEALKDAGYNGLNGPGFCPVGGVAVHRDARVASAVLPTSALVSYEAKLDVAEDIDHGQAAQRKRFDGSEPLQHQVLYRMRVLEGKSYAQIMKYVRGEGFGSSWNDSTLRRGTDQARRLAPGVRHGGEDGELTTRDTPHPGRPTHQRDLHLARSRRRGGGEVRRARVRRRGVPRALQEHPRLGPRAGRVRHRLGDVHVHLPRAHIGHGHRFLEIGA